MMRVRRADVRPEQAEIRQIQSGERHKLDAQQCFDDGGVSKLHRPLAGGPRTWLRAGHGRRRYRSIGGLGCTATQDYVSPPRVVKESIPARTARVSMGYSAAILACRTPSPRRHCRRGECRSPSRLNTGDQGCALGQAHAIGGADQCPAVAGCHQRCHQRSVQRCTSPHFRALASSRGRGYKHLRVQRLSGNRRANF